MASTSNGTSDNGHLSSDSPIAGKRILVADDQDKIRSVVKMILGKQGARIAEAGDGVETLKALREAHEKGEPFDLLFLDLMMPNMNGVTALMTLRREPEHADYADLPVVVMTAVKEQRVLVQCAKLGLSAIILKPPQMKQILEEAEKALVTARQARDAAVIEKEADPDVSGMYDVGEDLDEQSPIGFPIVFKGFPMSKEYALRLGYYRCPFDETTFMAPRLINRALKPVDDDRYALGLYKEAQDREWLEYPLIEMILCPACLYTSDRTGFYRIRVSSKETVQTVRAIELKKWEPVFFPMNMRIQEALTAEELTREKSRIARTAGDTGQCLFRLGEADPKYPRSHEDALVTLELALLSTQAMLECYTEEAEARIRQKMAGFLLKRAHVLELMAELHEGADKVADYRERALASKREAREVLLAINDVEFRVLQERLYCLARRFWLADELIDAAADKAQAEELAGQRKKAMGEMKTLLMQQRQENPEDVPVIERFMEPLENRLYDLEKAAKSGVADA